ncbi:MAG: hypothetical protein H8E25_10845 [Planctomycetes bacterium]|nr:hypothetical protein [Planctomycetota bacterium]
MNPENTFVSFYFLLGLGSVVVFFLSAAMIGFALFSNDLKLRHKLLSIQTVFFFIEVITLVFVSKDASATLAALPVEPDLSMIGAVSREVISFLLLGLSLVFSGLLTAFGWIKCGRANAAFAILVITIFNLKASLASLSILDVLGRAANPARENGIGIGEFSPALHQAFTDVSSSFNSWLPIMAALLGLSAYLRIRSRARNRAN